MHLRNQAQARATLIGQTPVGRHTAIGSALSATTRFLLDSSALGKHLEMSAWKRAEISTPLSAPFCARSQQAPQAVGFLELGHGHHVSVSRTRSLPGYSAERGDLEKFA
jgi:hypothetical protein